MILCYHCNEKLSQLHYQVELESAIERIQWNCDYSGNSLRHESYIQCDLLTRISLRILTRYHFALYRFAYIIIVSHP